MLFGKLLKVLALFFAASFLLIVGMIIDVQQMYLMAVALLLLPFLFWLLGLYTLKGIRCSRTAPPTCTEGERIRVDLTVRNVGRLPTFYLRATDRLPRWMRYAGNASVHGSLLLDLWGGEEGQLAYYLEPMKRGLNRIGPARTQAPDLLGFSGYVREVPAFTDVLVFPLVIRVQPDFLASGLAFGWRDQENGQTRGGGIDFHGVREYRSGDDLRRINWKTTARTGSLAVTEYALGYATDVTIAMDLSAESYSGSGEGRESALEYGIKIAVAIGAGALRQGSEVRLVASDSVQPVLGPLRGYEELPKLLEYMARAEATGATPFEEILSEWISTASQTSALVCITPRPEHDPIVRSWLSTWTAGAQQGRSMLFWLDREAFGNYVPTIDPQISESPVVTRTAFGREYHIRPGVNLALMFNQVQ